MSCQIHRLRSRPRVPQSVTLFEDKVFTDKIKLKQGHQRETKPKGNPPRIFFRRTEAEAPILWPPDEKSQLIGKDSDAGKDLGQEEKGTTV